MNIYIVTVRLDPLDVLSLDHSDAVPGFKGQTLRTAVAAVLGELVEDLVLQPNVGSYRSEVQVRKRRSHSISAQAPVEVRAFRRVAAPQSSLFNHKDDCRTSGH